MTEWSCFYLCLGCVMEIIKILLKGIGTAILFFAGASFVSDMNWLVDRPEGIHFGVVERSVTPK
jgi:hypothetical protein